MSTPTGTIGTGGSAQSNALTRRMDNSRHKIYTYPDFTRHDPSHIYQWPEIEERFTRIKSRHRNDAVSFFRHGSTKYNERKLVSGQHDTMLSERGRDQARQLKATVPPRLDLIICSKLTRSVETMQLSVPPAAQKGVPIFVDSRINEVNLGILQGKRRIFLPEFERGDLDFAPNNGESYRQAANRVLSFVVDVFDRLALCGPSPTVGAVFCHAGVLRIIATLISKASDPREVFKTNLGNAERLDLHACEMNFPAYWKELTPCVE